MPEAQPYPVHASSPSSGPGLGPQILDDEGGLLEVPVLSNIKSLESIEGLVNCSPIDQLSLHSAPPSRPISGKAKPQKRLGPGLHELVPTWQGVGRTKLSRSSAN
ncbi:hypothetical protein V6N13_037548 [Hibiscus sabdariffa]|uniref:Uncharacterized protein n=1 Tax=Hibiscus sabdariffa TaxID=183260 RepID=A0ABR2S4U8_9ROSI